MQLENQCSKKLYGLWIESSQFRIKTAEHGCFSWKMAIFVINLNQLFLLNQDDFSETEKVFSL